MNYREDFKDANSYKSDYLNGIKEIIKKREKDAEKIREDYFKDIFNNQEMYRNDFKNMLGWPLNERSSGTRPKAASEEISSDENVTVYRIKIEILEGLNMTGLLFKKDNRKRPLVIAQHGGEGTPELISGIYGSSANYNDITERILKYGANVFAPQLLLWNKETYDIDYNRENLDARLKRIGSSVTAIEVYGLTRILDYFENEDYVSNFGMIGLSYGGFYTLFTAAADTRIKSAVSCSWFNNRAEYAWNDWTWFDAAKKFSDAETACLIYPRKLCIEVGIQDELFDIKSAEKEAIRLQEMCSKINKDWLDIIYFNGTHEFCKDDEPIKKLIDSIK